MRITSNYNRAIRTSEIICLYRKFDTRVLPLLRLFRYFARVRSAYTLEQIKKYAFSYN